MPFMSKRPHQNQRYECNLLDQTALLLKQIDQGIMLSCVQVCLVVHQEVKIENHVVFVAIIGVCYRLLHLIQFPIVKLDYVQFFNIIFKACSVIIKTDGTLFKPEFTKLCQIII